MLVLLVLLATAGCKKVENILDITFNITKTDNFTVPRSPAGFPIPASGVQLPVFSQNVNTTDDFKNNGTSAELIKDATLKKFTLSIPESSGEDFGFLKSIEIKVSSPANPNQEILAHLHDIPANAGKILALVSSNISLAKYIRDTGFTLHTTVVVDEPTMSDIPVKTEMSFKVIANPVKE